MTDYSKLSDFEINKAVALARHDHCDIESVTQRVSPLRCLNSIAIVKFKDAVELERFNYCNNWKDGGEIIEKYGINLNRSSLTMDGYIWQAGRNIKVQHRDKNPLRAAMICFLKMKDAEK